jgi:hypothetical protein
MFKHPLSYLIYGEAFDALPPAAKDQFYVRLHEVLTGKDRSKDFAGLNDQDRAAILGILVATKKGLPGFFSATAK